MSKIVRYLILGIMLAFITGCTTSSQGLSAGGIKNSNFTNKQENSVEVMKITSTSAYDLAKKVIERIYPEDVIEFNSHTQKIQFIHRNFFLGDVQTVIDVKLVHSKKNSELRGYIYDVTNTGVGVNASIGPGYVANDFFKELKKVIQEEKIDVININDYKVSQDKGIAKKVASSLPTTYVGFQNYLDEKNNISAFEGIWETEDGFYTLGIVKNQNNRKYQYSAFVVESKNKNWKNGEIKFNFRKLIEGKFSTAKVLTKNKTELGMTCTTESDYIRCLSRAVNMEFNMFKVYPSIGQDATAIVNGVGTGWAVSEDGVFATNAHVVKNAEKIFVGFKEDNPLPARVIMIDNRIDLALLKVNTDKDYVPIPINTNIIGNGSDITVIGYPLAFTLGDDPRVTTGVISAQSGVKKDITRYQISAPIQPGNSGGPIINNRGEVIGIVVSKLNDNSMQTVNFGIKSSYLQSMMSQLNLESLNSSSKNLTSKQIFNKYKNSILPVWTK